MNKCIYHRTRSHKKQYYGYCTKYKKDVPLFCKCNEIEYKERKTLKSRTYKQAKKERERFSILQQDTSKCAICGSKYCLTWHEIYSGKNRSNSMKFGLCLRMCWTCHEENQESKEFNNYWHKKGQLIFATNYPDLDFFSIFRRNYI